MTFTVSNKKMGLLFVGLFVALCASFAFSTTAQAANATWINRATIKYGDGFVGEQYFVDTDTFDGNFTFVSTQGSCQDLVVVNFNGSGSDQVRNFNFYYSAGNDGSFPGDVPTTANVIDKEALGSGVNAGLCSEKSSTPVGIDNPDNRRISYVLHGATRRITNVITGTIFDYAGTTPASWTANASMPIYVDGSDPSVCKATIVRTEADPWHEGFNEGPFDRGGTIPGSSTLYTGIGEARGEDVGLERISEAFNDTVNFIPGGTKCKVDNHDIESPGGRHPLLPANTTTLGGGSYDKWLIAGGFRANGTIESSGDREDDAYIIFVGDATNNTIPPAAGGTPGGTAPGSGAGSPVEVCQDNVSGMGHILCPLLNGFDSIMRGLYTGIIVPFLSVPPLTTIAGLQEVWQNILIVANILFVIVFFIIIFSQATSIGITNYGIKSLLPKLIAIAVLTNLSFYICVLAVDVSNVLGAGISSLILVSLQGLPPVSVDFNMPGSLNDVAAFLGTGFLLSAAVAAQGGIIAVVAALGIPIVLATVMTVLALVLRLVLIVGFVALSPIVFIGFILPGTARISSRLLMGFLNLLWIGPIIMAVVALNGVVAYVISLVLS